MKALPSIAFNEFRGTAKEVTARKVKGRTVLNGRAQHSRKKTPKQALRRANFAFITRQYKTLTAEQMKAWEQLAAQHREKALIGDGEPLTAHNLFVCLNANRAAVGVPLTKEAPENIHGSSYINYDDIFITPTRLMITGLSYPKTPTTKLVVKMATTASNGVTKAWGNTVMVGESYTPDWGDVDLTEIYLKQFGVPVVVGQNYFFEMYYIDENSGYVSEITRVCFPAEENISINGNEYAPRVTLKTEDVIDNEYSAMDNLDLELSTRQKIVSVDLTTERLSGYSAGTSYASDTIPDDLGDIMLFMWSRGTEDNRTALFLGCSEILIRQNGNDNVTISNRGGSYTDKEEMFGTVCAFDW